MGISFRRFWPWAFFGAACLAAFLLGVGAFSRAQAVQVAPQVISIGADCYDPSMDFADGEGGIAFVGDWSQDSEVYFASHGPEGWSDPVNVSQNDTGDRSPSFSMDDSGNAGIAYVGWDAENLYEVYYAERVEGSWVATRVTSFETSVTSCDLVLHEGQPHLLVNAGRHETELYHVYRNGGGAWHVEPIEGPASTGYETIPGERDIASGGGRLAWAWTRLLSPTQVMFQDTGMASAEVLPPNDSADSHPHIEIDEAGRLRILYSRTEGSEWDGWESRPYYVREDGAGGWIEHQVDWATSRPEAFSYDTSAAACGTVNWGDLEGRPEGAFTDYSVTRYSDPHENALASYALPFQNLSGSDVVMDSGKTWVCFADAPDGELSSIQVYEIPVPGPIDPTAVLSSERSDFYDPSVDARDGVAAITFLGDYSEEREVLYSEETSTGWTTPVNVSQNDTGDRQPVVALGAGGERGVAYLGWDATYGYQMYFSELVGGSWEATRVTSFGSQVNAVDLTYHEGQPHAICSYDETVTAVPFIEHVYRDGAGSWHAEQLEGTIHPGSRGSGANDIGIASGGESPFDPRLGMTWTRGRDEMYTAVMYQTWDMTEPEVLPPNDSQDNNPHIQVDERGALRILYDRWAPMRPQAYYVREDGGGGWLDRYVGGTALTLAYDDNVALTAMRDGHVYLKAFADGSDSPGWTYEYDAEDGATDVAFSDGTAWVVAAEPSASGLSEIRVRKMQVPVTGEADEPPVAEDDQYATGQATQLSVDATGVLGNDSDADGDTLAAELSEEPGHGTVELAGDGSFVYTPEPEWVGDDVFRYRAYDGELYSPPATVTVLVEPDTTPPSAPALIGNVVDGSRIDLAWTPSSDSQTGIDHYAIWDIGTTPASLVATTTDDAYSHGFLPLGEEHAYAVAAVDGAGNASAQSNGLKTWAPPFWAQPLFIDAEPNDTADTAFAGPPRDVVASPNYYGFVDDATDEDWYSVWVDAGQTLSVSLSVPPDGIATGSSVRWRGYFPDGTVAFEFGKLGVVSSTASVSFTVPPGMGGLYKCRIADEGPTPPGVVYGMDIEITPMSDTWCPEPLSGLTVVDAGLDYVDLAWSPSADDAGPVGYGVFDLDTGQAVASVWGTSVRVTGLAPDTTYTFGVGAFDAGGNLGVGTPIEVRTDGLASSVSGTVTGTGGPLAGIQVSLYSNATGTWKNIRSQSTDAYGAYAFSGVTSGDYRVGFYDPNGLYIREYYDDASSFAAASTLSIGPGSGLMGIDAEMAGLGSIRGEVTGGGSPLPGLTVKLYRHDGATWRWTRDVLTGADGSYLASGLREGTYRVSFYDPSGVYIREWWDDVSSIGAARDVPVTPGGTASGISGDLAGLGSVSGTVTTGAAPVPGLTVKLYRWNGTTWLWVRDALTLADGTYLAAGLREGTYRVSFYDPSGVYIREWWDDVSSIYAATDVAVAAGGVASGIDAEVIAR